MKLLWLEIFSRVIRILLYFPVFVSTATCFYTLLNVFYRFYLVCKIPSVRVRSNTWTYFIFFSIALTNVFPEIFLEYDNNRIVQMGIDLNTTNYEHNIPTDFLSLPNHFKNSRPREIYLLTAFVWKVLWLCWNRSVFMENFIRHSWENLEIQWQNEYKSITVN